MFHQRASKSKSGSRSSGHSGASMNIDAHQHGVAVVIGATGGNNHHNPVEIEPKFIIKQKDNNLFFVKNYNSSKLNEELFVCFFLNNRFYLIKTKYCLYLL